MTPQTFLDVVAQPNTVAALTKPDDMQAIVNAILTLDALAGLLHAEGKAIGRPEIAAHAEDEAYREALAHVSPSYRALRDAAALLKHGALDHPRKRRLARLFRQSDAMQTVPNGLGLFQFGDRLGSDVIVIEFDPGPGWVRASDVIADTSRMLRRIVEGGSATTDEHDRTSLAGPANAATLPSG